MRRSPSHATRWILLASGLSLLVACSPPPMETEYRFGNRQIVLRGGDSHQVVEENGRFTARLSGHEIVIEAGGISIDGKRQPLPQAARLVIELDDDGIQISHDGQTTPPLANTAPMPEPASAPALPSSFRRLGAGEGNAETLLREGGEKRARDALAAALKELGGYFDHGIEDIAGFGDTDGRLLQAGFVAHRAGQPVNGLLVVSSDGRKSSVAVLYGPAQDFRRQLPALIDALPPGLRGTARQKATEPVQWRQVRLPDGSGQLRLPAGWRIVSAYQGAVDVRGSRDENVSLGFSLPIPTPEAATIPGGGMMPGAVTAYPGDPVTTLQQLAPRLAARMGAQLQIQRIIETAPVSSVTGGQAAFVLYDLDLNGQALRALSLIDCSPVNAGWWSYYYSTVGAPVERFADALPVMMKVWESWSVNSDVLRKRLQQALGDMQETNRMLTGAANRRMAAFERGLTDWTEVFRGDRAVEDTRTGYMGFTDIGWVNEQVARMNEYEGYARYRAVPLRELLGK